MSRSTSHIILLTTLILAGVFLISPASIGQTLEVESFAQKTVMGLQSGYTLGFRAAKGFGIGLSYQSTKHLSFETGVNNYPFMGLDLSFPIKKGNDISLLGHLKPGIVNQQFVVIVPELETRIAVAPFAKIGIGAGFRSREATISGKIILTTF